MEHTAACRIVYHPVLAPWLRNTPTTQGEMGTTLSTAEALGVAAIVIAGVALILVFVFIALYWHCRGSHHHHHHPHKHTPRNPYSASASHSTSSYATTGVVVT